VPFIRFFHKLSFLVEEHYTIFFIFCRHYLSQEKFAFSIGMDRTYFASVESGKRNVSILNLEKIIRGLGVSFSDFLILSIKYRTFN